MPHEINVAFDDARHPRYLRRVRILSRYVLRLHVGPFFFGLSLVFFVLVLDLILQVLKIVISKSLPTGKVIELLALNLAWMAALAVPMAVLVATLMAFGRLSSDNEITAMKACGVSPTRAMLPVIIASAALAAGLIWFNDRVLPDANHRARQLYAEIRHERPALVLKDYEGVFLDDFEGYSILIRSVDEYSSNISDVLIFESKGRRFPRVITARSGHMAFTEDKRDLVVTLYDGEVHEADEKDPKLYRRLRYPTYVITIEGVGEDPSGAEVRRGDREMSVAMLRTEIDRAEAMMAPLRGIIAKQADAVVSRVLGHAPARAAPAPNRDVAVRRALGRLRDETRRLSDVWRPAQGSDRRIQSLKVEVQKKFSIPVACLVFVMVGAPLGVLARRSGAAIALGLSLGFFVLYWAFLIGGEELADRMIVSPAVAMWAPNVLLAVFGLVVLRKASRELPLVPIRTLLKRGRT